MTSASDDRVPVPASRPRRLVIAAVAAVAWFGVVLQFGLTLHTAQGNGKTLAGGVAVYLGFFTVLTNIFVALVLTLPRVAPSSRAGRFFGRAQVAGCAAASITVVGVGYHLLLRHVWNPQGWQWGADVTLHYAVPLSFVLCWLFVLPKPRLPWRSPWGWCLYPIVYVGYVLVRGVLLQSYPYPFIDVAVLGYGRAMLNAAGLLVVFLVTGWVYVGWSRAFPR